MRLNYFLLFLVPAALSFIQCNDEDPKKYKQILMIGFSHNFDNEKLVFDNQTYLTSNGDSFTPSKLIYHVNNFQLISEDGTTYRFENKYALINPATGNTQIELGTFPLDDFVSLAFDLGVRDSTININGGLNDQFIDPMYWQMNSGYINFKLEGNSPSSPNEGVTMHIGGYKSGQETAQEIRLTLPNKLTNNQGLSQKKELNINVDLSKLFSDPSQLPLRYFHKIHKPGDTAQMVSKNFPNMFNF
ncbi:MAG: Uncharacterised protein [Bacteroidetes bacterium MED-G17]|nr:MAG: hypothetical protein CBB99_04000 [Bacteroidetes bacterium TMED39]CAI8261772.1 MAG: Uncharacterised protein [Bacteroidetes bacterium MED-G17]|tara:strand:+ start:297 stop:1031 length:735 start_codon:yes stop_codon:yes gene_type:complete